MGLVVPIYMLTRYPKKSSGFYTKKQLIKGKVIFFLGLAGIIILLYNTYYLPYRTGTFDLLDLSKVFYLYIASVYIFSAFALLRKDLGLMAFGLYTIFIILFIYLIALLNYDIDGYNYSAHRNSVRRSSGYIFGSMIKGAESYRATDYSLEDIIDNKYSDILLVGRDRITLNDNYNLYYKRGQIAPFTGISVQLNDENDSILRVSYFETGVRKKVETFLDNGVEKLEKYYNSGQIRYILVHKDWKLCDEYKEYYDNGQLKYVFVPYQDKLDAKMDIKYKSGIIRENVELTHGIRRRYHENGQLEVELIYDNAKLLPRKIYNEKGELTGERM
ncbi:MAG: toxin-antitoxin system YwqK family antitoxin [Halothermotrichaceae bacterium]